MASRRNFLKTATATGAAAGALGLTAQAANAEKALETHAADKNLKITAVEPIRIKGARYGEHVMVRIRTNQGIEGIGEGFARESQATAGYITSFGERLIGKEPFRIEAFLSETIAEKVGTGNDWQAAIQAISAIEIALWDIVGKAAGLPVYAMLGGAVRDRIPLYADHGVFKGGFSIDRILMTKEAGFEMFKWDPFRGGGNPGEEQIAKDVETVRKVREAVGPDHRIAIDAHGRYDLHGAKIAARLLEPLDILFFEEPVHYTHPEWFPVLARETSLTLGTGEMLRHIQEVQTIVDTGAIGVLQPELGNIGGILRAYQASLLAAMRGVRIAMHDWCGPVVSRAATHVCAVIPNLLYQEWASTAPEDSWELDLFDPPTRIEKGRIALPDGPGLGFTLNEELVAKRRVG